MENLSSAVRGDPHAFNLWVTVTSESPIKMAQAPHPTAVSSQASPRSLRLPSPKVLSASSPLMSSSH